MLRFRFLLRFLTETFFFLVTALRFLLTGDEKVTLLVEDFFFNDFFYFEGFSLTLITLGPLEDEEGDFCEFFRLTPVDGCIDDPTVL